MFLRGGDWDAVVIQDQSQRPSFGASYVSKCHGSKVCQVDYVHLEADL